MHMISGFSFWSDAKSIGLTYGTAESVDAEDSASGVAVGVTVAVASGVGSAVSGCFPPRSRKIPSTMQVAPSIATKMISARCFTGVPPFLKDPAGFVEIRATHRAQRTFESLVLLLRVSEVL